MTPLTWVILTITIATTIVVCFALVYVLLDRDWDEDE